MLKSEVFDAAIIGSGATGGWAAKKLTEAGLKVAVIEAGRKLDPSVDFTEHAQPFDSPLRNMLLPRKNRQEQYVQRHCYQCDEMTSHLFIKDTEHPYTTPADRPFFWIRGRHVGGKSITWARQSYRFSNYDLKAASRDGWGVDWPMRYEDLAPYYDEVEEFIGVSGMAEGLPHLPDGHFLPPMNLSCGEWLMRKSAKAKLGLVVTIGRCAVLTRDWKGRPKCHYCGPCSRGCATGSYFSSPASTLPAAEKTGRMTLMPNQIVSHITVNENGKPKGVWCVDSATRRHREIKAKVIVLCASTLESTRILLNSTSSFWPNGLGNNSGVLGHYLTDHISGGGAEGILPIPDGVRDSDGNRPTGIYVPRFRNIQNKSPAFIRGYGLQGWPFSLKWGHAYALPGFGADFKRRVKETTPPWFMNLTGFGESLTRYENHCRIDKVHVDQWGIPVLHIDAAFGDNERAMLEDMAESAAEILEAAGARDIKQKKELSPPGLVIHEVGTARMGNDPKTSFLNSWNQSHELKNLFVTDGSCFPSSGCQNPTLTLMALTARACDFIVEEFQKGNL